MFALPRFASILKKNIIEAFALLQKFKIQNYFAHFKVLLEERLSDSPSWNVADSSTRGVGESFLDYEYLRQFEAKIRTARKVV
jgi:hypothetical protein